MNSDKTTKKGLYYSIDHEWIDFHGSVAYVGVCSFKLLGFKLIEQIVFAENSGFKKQGETIAAIKYNDYEIRVNMPVDGKIININDVLLADRQNILLQYAESSGWIALIAPSKPYERKGLLPPEEYKQKQTGKLPRF